MAGSAATDAETKRITDLIKRSGQLRKPKVWPPAKMGPGEKKIAFGISEDHYGRDARWKGGAWTDGRTHGRKGRPSYRDGRTHLKMGTGGQRISLDNTGLTL